ncbi:MAG: hypothetical protein KDK70_34340, partial [Myxococcales bacterium]|nr:hypothetical protein [Myxococcales bacterium]
VPAEGWAIGWWEGSSAAVHEGLTAEIFDILTRVPAPLLAPKVEERLDRLAKHHAQVLEGDRLDPQTAGHALAGLLRRGAMTKAEARLVIERLLAARDGDHWEPTWFHAYGGRVDATLAVLQALQLVDPTGAQVDKRDALAWILATRPTWGDWHHAAGTAAALRALSVVGAAPEAAPATLVVELDGKPLRRLTVDPDDPVGSTLAAQHIDLGESLGPGTHRVSIDYDGTLQPVATVVTQTATPGKAAVHAAGGLSLRAAGRGDTRVDQSVTLVVHAKGKRLGGATLLISPSGLLEPDLGALGRRVGRGGSIAAVEPTPHGLALTVAPDVDELTVGIPLVVEREGSGRWPTVALVPRSGRRKATPLVVDPGALEVRGE